ncbi:MAG: hypothetical protein FJ399_21655, partial [Verrucomicrobia bacterium]|nr:hypothetical protein [Verrucomicrobiota bacterium]
DYHPNQPLKGYKGSIWEGGHRVPFLARWPGMVPAGTINSGLVAHLDMAATFAAIAGAKLPDGGCLDSFNVLPTITSGRPVRPHFVAHTGGTEGPFSLHRGDWKFLEVTAPVREPDSLKAPKTGQDKAKAKGKAGPRQPGLYHLAADLSEEKNLADQQPAKLKEMQDLLAQLRREPSSRQIP